MGDVLAITDTEGSIVGNYEYDAWGKVLTADTDIAKQNPLRYRGYYYDKETGYYYLQSRYYDTDICRFINADIAEVSKMSKNIQVGTNIFAYCNNNPVNNSDPEGYIINLDLEFSRASIVSSVLSALGTILLIALRKNPWGKIFSIAISLAAIIANIYSYARANNYAKRIYGKRSYKFRIVKKYNNVILITNVALIIVSDLLSARFVKTHSTKIALALLGCRTITIVGLSINLGELLSGKSVMYRKRYWK